MWHISMKRGSKHTLHVHVQDVSIIAADGVG
jgi:hypothetical protein